MQFEAGRTGSLGYNGPQASLRRLDDKKSGAMSLATAKLPPR
jgi:hypothetical protein